MMEEANGKDRLIVFMDVDGTFNGCRRDAKENQRRMLACMSKVHWLAAAGAYPEYDFPDISALAVAGTWYIVQV